MGNIAFVLCYLEDSYDTLQQKNNNRNKLKEFAKDKLFSSYSDTQVDTLLWEYGKAIEDIRKKYHNPSAHTNEIKRIDAEGCFNLVLDVEKLLKKMLDSFDF